ncbi:hypothetical protein [Bacillus cereus]|uniref:hypothetical protein n=1 Tax=Bacillus cereus TaxID=1396 RepID=UPI00032E33A7|nr:hypothetical protein [Bacillus cereus]EOO20010.1 hypothetical protein IG9_01070 [Bacillus cereus HuA2-9]
MKINGDHYEEFRNYGFMTIDGVKYEQHDELESDMNDNGRYDSYILQRESDQKFFQLNVYYVRYGYEDYGFEISYQDKEIYEVEEQVINITKWVSVKEGVND